MDLTLPIRSVIPTLRGPVLMVLARADRAFTGREVERLLPVPASHGGVKHALDALVEHGIVFREEAGRSALYRFNREHVAAPVVEAAVALRETFLARLRELVRPHHPRSAVLFGSAARGDGDPGSDIDLLLVWPAAEDVVAAEAEIEELATHVERLTGNPCRILSYTVDEVSGLRHRNPALLRALLSEGVHLGGEPLEELVAGESA